MSEMTDDLDWFDRDEPEVFPCRTCGAFVGWFNQRLFDEGSTNEHDCRRSLHDVVKRAAKRMERSMR